MVKDYEQLIDTSILGPSAAAWKNNGRKIIGTICCHVPEEFIHAASLLPVRIRATDCSDDSLGETWMSSFSCAYARACLQFLLDGTYDFLDGMVGADGCMMAQRIFDNWGNISERHFKHFLLAPRLYSDKGISFYRKELEDLKIHLEAFSGASITDKMLKNSINLYNETRRLIRELYALRKSEAPVINGEETLKMTLAAMSMPKEEYNVLLHAFLAKAKTRKPISDYRARLMIVGSAIDDPSYLKIIEGVGGLIVTDVQCYGSRYLWEEVEQQDGDDPLTSLAKSYLKRNICPRMGNLHDGLYTCMTDMVNEYKVDGIISVTMKNCVPWGGERIFFEDKLKDANIPLLLLDHGKTAATSGQLATRVEAFMEVIEEARK